jgi:hypothetical protein
MSIQFIFRLLCVTYSKMSAAWGLTRFFHSERPGHTPAHAGSANVHNSALVRFSAAEVPILVTNPSPLPALCYVTSGDLADPGTLAWQVQIYLPRKEAAQPMIVFLFVDSPRFDPNHFLSRSGACENLS